MAQSYGMMVNYLYDLGAIEANHEAFRQSGRVAASAAVAALLKNDRQRRAIKWPIRSTTH
jgi:malonyl-CoA decarboxylase